MNNGSTSAQATGAPASWHFKGRDYELHPLKLVDIGRVNEIMRSRFITRTVDGMNGAESAANKTAAWLVMSEHMHARADVYDLTRGGNAVNAMLRDPVVLVAILWCSLRRGDAALTREQVGEWFGYGDIDALESACKEVFRISGFDLAGDGEEGSATKNAKPFQPAEADRVDSAGDGSAAERGGGTDAGADRPVPSV